VTAWRQRAGAVLHGIDQLRARQSRDAGEQPVESEIGPMLSDESSGRPSVRRMRRSSQRSARAAGEGSLGDVDGYSAHLFGFGPQPSPVTRVDWSLESLASSQYGYPLMRPAYTHASIYRIVPCRPRGRDACLPPGSVGRASPLQTR
jgi:hypothetical protein